MKIKAMTGGFVSDSEQVFPNEKLTGGNNPELGDAVYKALPALVRMLL